MNKEEARLHVLEHALPHIPFDGWTDSVLALGATEAGLTPESVPRLFPGGAANAIALFIERADTHMLDAWEALQPKPGKVRERIATLVWLRLTAYQPQREVVRRTLAWYALPSHAHLGVKALAHTADLIWKAAGDNSTDFNWYTKRMLLGGVYSSTLLCWLSDDSSNHAETHAFLDRRIRDVMQIQKWKKQLFSFPKMSFGQK